MGIKASKKSDKLRAEKDLAIQMESEKAAIERYKARLCERVSFSAPAILGAFKALKEAKYAAREAARLAFLAAEKAEQEAKLKAEAEKAAAIQKEADLLPLLFERAKFTVRKKDLYGLKKLAQVGDFGLWLSRGDGYISKQKGHYEDFCHIPTGPCMTQEAFTGAFITWATSILDLRAAKAQDMADRKAKADYARAVHEAEKQKAAWDKKRAWFLDSPESAAEKAAAMAKAAEMGYDPKWLDELEKKANGLASWATAWTNVDICHKCDVRIPLEKCRLLMVEYAAAHAAGPVSEAKYLISLACIEMRHSQAIKGPHTVKSPADAYSRALALKDWGPADVIEFNNKKLNAADGKVFRAFKDLNAFETKEGGKAFLYSLASTIGIAEKWYVRVCPGSLKEYGVVATKTINRGVWFDPDDDDTGYWEGHEGYGGKEEVKEYGELDNDLAYLFGK